MQKTVGQKALGAADDFFSADHDFERRRGGKTDGRSHFGPLPAGISLDLGVEPQLLEKSLKNLGNFAVDFHDAGCKAAAAGGAGHRVGEVFAVQHGAAAGDAADQGDARLPAGLQVNLAVYPLVAPHGKHQPLPAIKANHPLPLADRPAQANLVLGHVVGS
ncbi:MAG: hypothetical protein V3S29_00935 [bacterium]